jgi:FkbM family methyltransferase
MRAVAASPRVELRRLLWERAVGLPVVFEDSHGLRYVLNPGENAGIYLANDGNYEVRETRFCERVLRPGMSAFDVGANIGLYTMLFSRRVGIAGVVHAFEPDPENLRRLRVNLALNEMENVRVTPAAVYSRAGTVQLHVFPPSLNAWHSLGRPTLPDPFHPGRTTAPIAERSVEATTLDDHCDRHGIDRIDLLKIDVEGAELDVLRGGAALLGARRVGVVLFEVSLPQTIALGHSPADLFGELESRGYTSYGLDVEGRPTARRPEPAEYANYVAAADPELLGVD